MDGSIPDFVSRDISLPSPCKRSQMSWPICTKWVTGFEPVQEELLQTTGRGELANLEDYSRRELPRLFRSVLETAVNNEAQPIEGRLRGQLISMIRDCQERIFSNYRATQVTGSRSPNSAAEPENASPTTNLQPSCLNQDLVPAEPEISSATTKLQLPCISQEDLAPSESSNGPRPSEGHLETSMELARYEDQPLFHEQQGQQDSGYGSNKSASGSSPASPQPENILDNLGLERESDPLFSLMYGWPWEAGQDQTNAEFF
jgi:hypothetical protein